MANAVERKKLRHRKITTELHVLLLGEFQTQLTMRVLLFVSVIEYIIDLIGPSREI